MLTKKCIKTRTHVECRNRAWKKLSDFDFKSMLRLVVAIICFCTVVICVVTGCTKLHPTQLKLPNHLNRNVIYQAISCLNMFGSLTSGLYLYRTLISCFQVNERELEFTKEQFCYGYMLCFMQFLNINPLDSVPWKKLLPLPSE